MCDMLCGMRSGVWCMCGVWCVVCGVWCVVCGVWCVVCGVWCVVCGVCGVCGMCVVYVTVVSCVWYVATRADAEKNCEGVKFPPLPTLKKLWLFPPPHPQTHTPCMCTCMYIAMRFREKLGRNSPLDIPIVETCM